MLLPRERRVSGYGGSGSAESTEAPYFGSKGRQVPAQYAAQA